MADPRAVICIPTFRRPNWLAATLRSLDAQRCPEGFAIVVVDNDSAAAQGAAVARAHIAESRQRGQVVIEPAQGNCHAINTAFATARACYPEAEYFLMLDDDEWADPDWLRQMIETADEFGADIVGGPVVRQFEGHPTRGVTRHPLYGSIKAENGPVDIIHGSGNCLIRGRVFEQLASPSFDTRFNFLGGGDMDFFTRCRKAGLAFAWSKSAILFERVPVERMSKRWIMQRSLRTGAINYTIQHLSPESSRGSILLRTLGSLGLAPFRALAALVTTRTLLPATHPLLVSVGRALASIGFAPQPYKAEPQSHG